MNFVKWNPGSRYKYTVVCLRDNSRSQYIQCWADLILSAFLLLCSLSSATSDISMLQLVANFIASVVSSPYPCLSGFPVQFTSSELVCIASFFLEYRRQVTELTMCCIPNHFISYYATSTFPNYSCQSRPRSIWWHKIYWKFTKLKQSIFIFNYRVHKYIQTLSDRFISSNWVEDCELCAIQPTWLTHYQHSGKNKITDY